MTDLLSCPFCGGEAKFIEEGDEIAIWCMGCKMCGGYREPSQRAEAIEAWNRRSPAAHRASPTYGEPVAWQVRWYSSTLSGPQWNEWQDANEETVRLVRETGCTFVGHEAQLRPLYASPVKHPVGEVTEEMVDDAVPHIEAVAHTSPADGIEAAVTMTWPDGTVHGLTMEQGRRAIAAALQRPLTASNAETGWLIELRGQQPTWWSLIETEGEGGYFTENSLKALRFARRYDASVYIEDAGWTEAFPSEHEWSDPPSPSQGVEKADQVFTYEHSPMGGGQYATTISNHPPPPDLWCRVKNFTPASPAPPASIQAVEAEGDAIEEAIYGRHGRGFIMRPLIDPPSLPDAITSLRARAETAEAALAAAHDRIRINSENHVARLAEAMKALEEIGSNVYVYMVEEDTAVYLKAYGQDIADWHSHSEPAMALLKLDAAIRSRMEPGK